MEWELYEVEERVFALLVIRLDGLIRRRIPVRHVSAGPVKNTARLRFGDGTALIVRSQRPGSSAVILKAILSGRSVLVESWEWVEEGLVLTLAVPARGGTDRHAMVLLGPDQPD